MIVYNLCDLSAIFKIIRMFPSAPKNEEIMDAVLKGLTNGNLRQEENLFRHMLRRVEGLDKNIFQFVFIENMYVVFEGRPMDELAKQILIKGCKAIEEAVKSKNWEKTEDLADALHNLPVLIVKNNMKIPKSFFKNELRWYIKKWGENFTL